MTDLPRALGPYLLKGLEWLAVLTSVLVAVLQTTKYVAI